MKIAVIQIRGKIGLSKKLKDTLAMLRLYKKNSCVVVDANPTFIGMANLLKDYVTWGEVSEDTFKLLLEKRGKIVGNKPLTENFLKEKTKMGYDEFVKSFYNNKIKLKDVPGFKPFFRLCPPVGGFERNGVKYSFSMGGVLGYRKDKINDLIRKML